ncbi:MAG: hypothetical protein LBC68_14130 [Prevotellaceae bacterium]|jgi:hypothetical protein|nr:hypothetical protein [Prevotellaceae bacterium]
MKKIIISVIVALTTMISFAQDQSSQHLSFKGVPIDGTLNEYVVKMKQSGFTMLGIKDGVATLKGDFAAYKGCIVGISTLKGKDLVNKIIVAFPECDTWSQLASNYFSLKEMLTQKYGKPSESVEKFQSSYIDDDNDRMYAVKSNRCTYYTTYKTEKGDIQLSISHGEVLSCFVLLAYCDKINGDIVRQQAMDDL